MHRSWVQTGQVHFRTATEYTGNWSGCVQASSYSCAPGQRQLARQMPLCSVRLPSAKRACACFTVRALVGVDTRLLLLLLLLHCTRARPRAAVHCCLLNRRSMAVRAWFSLIAISHWSELGLGIFTPGGMAWVGCKKRGSG